MIRKKRTRRLSQSTRRAARRFGRFETLEDRRLLATFVVTNTNDEGGNSLRSAIQQANSNPGLDFIDFNIPGSSVQTIRPTFGLPTITDQVFINGNTQPGYEPGKPLIELDGSLAGSAHGLEFRGRGGNRVEGLIIHSFSDIGIVLAEPDNPNPTGGTTIIGNFIGTDATGMLAKGNGHAGIHLVRSPDNRIEQNLISGNNDSGIFITDGFSTGNHIEGNLIGTDITGLSPLGNRLNGIALAATDIPFLREGNDAEGGYGSFNFIGGAGIELGNVIAGNGHAGIYIFRGTDNDVQGNYIGVGRDGTTPLPNGADTANRVFFGEDGIWIEEGSNNIIGGVAAGAGNLISGNVGAGVRITAVRESANDNRIQGNLIGTDKDGNFGAGLGNGAGGVHLRNEGSLSTVTASGNMIGGADGEDGADDGTNRASNIISGNLLNGITLIGHHSENNSIKGNFIGTDKDGTTAVPNQGDGVHVSPILGQLSGRPSALIGGAETGAGNVISGNMGNGVFIGHGAKAVVVGNYIGTDANGAEALGNGQHGVFIFESSDSFIGPPATPEEGEPDSLLYNVISGNVMDGVQIGGVSRNNRVTGNFIGINEKGIPLGNGRHGVAVFNAPGNFIGDATEVGGNDIVGNQAFGVLLLGPETQFTEVKGNNIHGNELAGVVVRDATHNTIGGILPGERNLISGNLGPGVQIEGGTPADENGFGGALNEVLGNYIGADANGDFSEGFGNFGSGVYIDNSAGNTIRGNTLRGNGSGAGDGITIAGETSRSNDLADNIITDSGQRGVRIFDQASENTIGGGEPGQGNVISSNPEGIAIEDGAHHNEVLGNQISLNEQAGVVLSAGAFENTIGLSGETFRNHIFANEVGVQIELSNNNSIGGNYIGADEAGSFNEGFGNTSAGVLIRDGQHNSVLFNTIRGNGLEGDDTSIGLLIDGAEARENVVSSNVITHAGLRGMHVTAGAANNSISSNTVSANRDGIVLDELAHDNSLTENRVGTDEVGSLQPGFGNADFGILILDSPDNLVSENTIRANRRGLSIGGEEALRNIVLGNLVTHNALEGVLLFDGASRNTIGFSDVEDEINTIYSNGQGVRLEAAHENFVRFNWIGTDATLTVDIGNTGEGVTIVGGQRNEVHQNIILGNGAGISIAGPEARENAVRNNRISNNSGDGVRLLDGASDNVIGGPATDADNRISNNLKAGVVIESGTGNAILRNRIFDNGGLGIDLGNDGISFNDKVNDADSGANKLQNFPELSFATVGGSRRIVGAFNSAPQTLYILEFFAGAAPDSSGHGEGDRFVTTTAVTTNASGVATFDVALPEGEVAGSFLSATATDPFGNTSEFSNSIRIEMDIDGDGIPDRIENNGPNSGDGNQDGVQDSQQSGIVSFTNAASGGYVTLVIGSGGIPAPPGAAFTKVRATPNPSPNDAPAGVEFTHAFFDFSVTGLTPGSGVAVELILPFGAAPQSYYRYGPTPDQPAPHWYDWSFDGSTGAIITDNRVTLTFGDGLRGDDDLLANGIIVDPGGPGFAPVIVVTNTLDSGPGSLRQAILSANNRPGLDFIDFGIGTGVQTIFPLSPLPPITDPVVIDGTTQPGFAGQPIVQLAAPVPPGQRGVGTAIELKAGADNSIVRGLVINRFSQAGIGVAADNVLIEGNYIGTDVTGLVAFGNQTGVSISASANGVVVGGTTAAARNVIAGNLGFSNSGVGVLVQGSGNRIEGNLIGLGADGVKRLANGAEGVSIVNASGNIVGGAVPESRNVISGNGSFGVLIQHAGATGNLVEGNYIGTNAAGTAAVGNSVGIGIQNAPNNTIRGNVISGNGGGFGTGVRVNGPSSGTRIVGNFIGTTAAGNAALPNGHGVHIDDAFNIAGTNVTVGGTTAADRNVISGNAGVGISVGADGGGPLSTGHIIRGNFIGVAADGVSPLGNGDSGVRLRQTASNVFIGGLEPGAGNVIAHNLYGVWRVGAATVLSNSIYSNTHLGLTTASTDRGWARINYNHLPTHQGLNYPVLGSAISADGQITISGYLNDRPNETFLLQFFSNPSVDLSGFGEGETLLGSANVTTDGGGHVDFTFTFDVAVPERHLITATTTLSSGGTSEFSRRLAVGDVLGSVYTVNTTDDVDDGVADAAHTSLREAIHAANNHPGPDVIRFNIGSGAKTIVPQTIVLPALTESVIIDATTQPGFAGTPIIELTGTGINKNHPSYIPDLFAGLRIFANNSTVRGLVINRFDASPATGTHGFGLWVRGNDSVIEGNYLGTNLSGTQALPNSHGLSLNGARNRIGGTTPQARNLLSGNREHGLIVGGGFGGATPDLPSTFDNVIQGNFIGTDMTGTTALGNGSALSLHHAVVVAGAFSIVGGAEPGAGNLISGNHASALHAGLSTVHGNFIGTDVTGTRMLGNSGDGIIGGTQVGGTMPGERNVVSNNRAGILAGNFSIIEGNLIGTDVTGTRDFGNREDGIVVINFANGSRIGGTAAGAGNVISGNDRHAILITPFSGGNSIQGNFVGVQADGTSPLGNGSDAIAIGVDYSGQNPGIFTSRDNRIGGTESGAGNIIAFNGGHGVTVVIGSRNTILSNSIYSNGKLGIDLNANGPTANDPGDADEGGNGLQNYPVLTAVVSDGIRTRIEGTFNSLPTSNFLLQFFVNGAAEPSGFGEGRMLLAFVPVSSDAAGNASFTLVVDSGVPAGQFITVTATNLNRFANDTSEFSAAVQVTSGPVEAENGPPTAAAGGPYAIEEGDALALDASASTDPDSDLLSYSWDANGDGVFGDATGSTPTLTWQQLQALGILDGPGSFIVRVRVDDGHGHEVTSAPTSLTIANVAPIADAGPDQMVNEGDLVTLIGGFSDPGTADTHTFHWHVVSSNGQVVADGSGPTFQFVPADNGTYTVTFTVTDDDGGVGQAEALIVVNPSVNVAPTITQLLAGPAQIAEGQFVTVTGSFTDADAQDTHTVLIDWGDGSLTPAAVDLAARTFSATRHYFDDDPTGTPADAYQITAVVSDDRGAGSEPATTSILVNNAAPRIVSFSSSALDCGCDSVTVTAAFTDAGIRDLHTAIIDWGDGTRSPALVSESDGSGVMSASHTYAQSGIYVVTLLLSDDDAGAASQTTQVLISGVGVHQGVLQVVGTAGDDHVTINPVGQHSYRIHASFFEEESFRDFPAAGIERIVVMFCGGNDFAHIAGSIDVPAILDGGEGNDQLKGGGGHDVLLGGDGDDFLDGGGNWGRDLLIGGRGTDLLLGNAGDDLLIAGSTAFDDDAQALAKIMAEWTSPRDYPTRVDNLRGNGSEPRLNGEIFLDSAGPDATVFDDGQEDTLTGGSGRDWFFAKLSDGVRDRLFDPQSAELLDELV